MKKYVVMLILFTLISLSGAVSEKKLEQQVGYNFGGLKLNQVDDTSGSATTVNIKDNSFHAFNLDRARWSNCRVAQSGCCAAYCYQ